jgi:magnesium-transporting ATPase (P-type)
MDSNNNNEELTKYSAPNLENEKDECLDEINEEFDIKNVAFQTVCIMSLIWNAIILIAICGSWYFYGLGNISDQNMNSQLIEHNYTTIFITIMSVIFYGVVLYSTILSIDGTYKIKKGITKGYNYFFRSNSIFLIILILGTLGNKFENIVSTIFCFTIFGLFRLQFKDYKQKMMSHN